MFWATSRAMKTGWESTQTASGSGSSHWLVPFGRRLRRSASVGRLEGSSLDALLLAKDVADQVMSNLSLLDSLEEEENEKGKGEEDIAADEEQPQRQQPFLGGNSGKHKRSLSDSGVQAVLQMADANQRACNRRQAQWEKMKKAQEQRQQKQQQTQEHEQQQQPKAQVENEVQRRWREREEQARLKSEGRLMGLFMPEPSQNDLEAKSKEGGKKNDNDAINDDDRGGDGGRGGGVWGKGKEEEGRKGRMEKEKKGSMIKLLLTPLSGRKKFKGHRARAKTQPHNCPPSYET